jgi:hypothetical protein
MVLLYRVDKKKSNDNKITRKYDINNSNNNNNDADGDN